MKWRKRVLSDKSGVYWELKLPAPLDHIGAYVDECENGEFEPYIDFNDYSGETKNYSTKKSLEAAKEIAANGLLCVIRGAHISMLRVTS